MQEVFIEIIALDGLDVKVQRDAQGIIDWSELVKINTNDTNPTKEDEKSIETIQVEENKPWHVTIKDTKLEKIKVRFDDREIVPHVIINLNELNLYAQNITLAGKDPLYYQSNFKINDTMACQTNGTLQHALLDLQNFVRCSGINLVDFKPYIDTAAKQNLQLFDITLENGVVGFDSNLTLMKRDAQVTIELKKANLFVDEMALSKTSTREPLLRWKNFSVLDIALSTKEKNVHIKKSLFQDLHADIKRLEDESINLEKIVLPLSTTNTKNTKVEPQKPYHIKLDKFLFQNGSVGLTDEALRTKPYVTLDKINFTVDAIDSKEKTWLKYDFGMRINKSGTLKTAGSLRHTPLKQKGTLTLNRVSLQGINPYLDELSYLSLSDGYINLNAKTSYEKSLKAPDVKLSGSFKMEEFFLKDTRDKSDLFSMNSLTLDAFDFEMFPNRFYVETVRLDSFYLHAHIDEKKSLNLATLMKKSPEQEEQQQEKREAKEPFPLKIAKVQVKNGSAKFADLSLPIKFETLIHDLNGTIYSVSNTKGEASILDMKGEVDRYGVTTLKGSIDSSNPKSYTDLRFDFKNLELSSVSGYSASFAGHKIDEGKLFLGLKYHIVDSQMQGDNSVIIKKIKLGEAYKDENTTSLPLGFVIALLEDSEGIIDIDLPIVGDVDNPDFKYGALVWKTISNLIVKAVTSPFKFLSAAMGLDGENLDTIEFEAGLSEILPPEREKLDNIAKMLIKRPKIGLKIDATYDAERDTKALQFQKLLDLVVQKSDKKNIEDKKSAITVEILQDIYKETGDSKKLQQLQKELKQNYKGEAYRIEYLKMLVKESSLLQEITQEELFSLAEDRGKKITEFLISEKLIERDKVELSQVIEAKKDISNLIKTQLGIKSIEE